MKADDVDDRLHVDPYYSEEDLADHSALREEDGSLRPGIRSYPLIYFDLDKLSDNGLKLKRSDSSAGQHYEVRTYVRLIGSSDKLEMVIDVMDGYYRFPREHNGQPYNEHRILCTFTRELWNKSMSHFVRDITGTAGPAGPVGPAGPAGPAGKLKPVKSAGPQKKTAKRKADASTEPKRKQMPKQVNKKRTFNDSESQEMDWD